MSKTDASEGTLRFYQNLDQREAGTTASHLRIVQENEHVPDTPRTLTEAEVKLFNDLKTARFNTSRLKQERLPPDYIQENLQQWLAQSRHL